MARGRRSEGTRDLLERYARTGTSECFEEIVRRYGAMVLAVCQGVTRNRHDAEDATQVTFFVLAERLRAGETIRSLGSWLGQVARRAAVDIRRSDTRRQRREQNRAAPEAAPDSVADHCNGDQIAAMVREELDRIPAKYRIPLVLHYFGGLDFAEAARELGLKPATLGVRLFRGRKLLGERLARRGVALSAPALAVCLARVIRGSLSQALRQSAARAACASGVQPLAAATPALGHGLLSALVSSKVKLLVAAALVMAATAGASAAAHHLPDFHNLLDLGRLRPRLPSIRSSLPSLRVDAGTHAVRDVHRDTTQVAANHDTAITIDVSRSTLTAAQPHVPAAPASDKAGAGGGVLAYSTAPGAGRPSLAAPISGVAVSSPARGGTGSIRGTPAATLSPSTESRAESTVALIGRGPTMGIAATPSASGVGRPTGGAGPTSIASLTLDTTTMKSQAFPAGAAIYAAGTGSLQDLGWRSSSGVTNLAGSPIGSASSSIAGSATPTNVSGSSQTGSKPVGSLYAGLLQITSIGPTPSQLSFLNPGDPSIPALPGGQSFLGVWAVPPGQPADVPLTVSYDNQLLANLGRDPSQVTLWAYDGKWSLMTGTGDTATINNPTNVQFFGIGTPEPTGTAIGAVVGLLLLMRRRRQRA